MATRGATDPVAPRFPHIEFLEDRPIELFPYEPFAFRVWELRENLTAYDAWYVALAEEVGAKLATLDGALCRAAGPRCGFLTPGSGAPSLGESAEASESVAGEHE